MTPYPDGRTNRDIRRGHGPRFRHRAGAGRWSQQALLNRMDADDGPRWRPTSAQGLRDEAILAVHDRSLTLEMVLARMADVEPGLRQRPGDDLRTWPRESRRDRLGERARPHVPLVVVTPRSPRAPSA